MVQETPQEREMGEQQMLARTARLNADRQSFPHRQVLGGGGGAMRIRWPYWSFSVPPGEDEAQDIVEVSVAG